MVEIRVAAGKPVAQVAMTPALTRQAAEWMYALRNRTRWAGDDDSRDALSDRAVKTLENLGIGKDAIRTFATAESRHVEVKFIESSADKTVTAEAEDSS